MTGGRVSKELVASVAWAWIYVTVAAFPLLIVLVGPPPGRSFQVELGAACGFLSLSVMTLQFALTARFHWLEPPLGTDLLYALHRHMTPVAVGLAVAHPVLLVGPGLSDVLPWLDPRSGPWPLRAGILAAVALLVVAATTYLRRQLRLAYDGWRRAHGVLALAAVGLAAWHALALGTALSHPSRRVAWSLYTFAFVALLLRVRVYTPWRLRRRPWVVERAVPDRGRCVAIVLRPVGHDGFRFEAGQFAWLTIGDSPFAAREHPLSISGAPHDAPRLEFTIKASGDWSHRVQSVAPGTTAYVDGPFGTLCASRYPRARGLGFIAGGVGIAPVLGHLRALAHERDPRPLVLIYGTSAWESTPAREELERLETQLRLRVVHVLERPHPAWTGETGLLDAAILARHLPATSGWEWFVCGPPGLMDTAERALWEAGVPLGRIHSERFDLA
jgi:predicted ferric reductase